MLYKKLAVFSLTFSLTACQGGVNNGISSHVAHKDATQKPVNQQVSNTIAIPVQQSANRPPVAPLPQQPKPQQQSVNRQPAQQAQQQMANRQPVEARPQPAIPPRQAANPNAGVPLSESSDWQEDSLAQVVVTPQSTSYPEDNFPPIPPAQPQTQQGSPYRISKEPARQPQQPLTQPFNKPATEPEPSWLSRYPHLAENYGSYEQTIQRLEEEVKNLQSNLRQLKQEVAKNWGKGTLPFTENAHQFIKYTDAYQSRSEMDFDSGKVIVETLEQNYPKERLKDVIVTTLLTPYDAENPEIYTAKRIDYSGPAILSGQIKDHEGQPVKWQWRAERYADYLVNNQMQQIHRDGHRIYRVEIPLVENHTQVRGQQYENLVRQASTKYNVDEALIYAIIETESSFNPYATSHVPAYGLMQIVPATAGKDVFTRIKKRNDQPTRDYLFNPANNIDAGTAYITILNDVYLKDIRHPQSREYAIISGYNGGAGNVLKTFHSDRKQAVNVINQLSPQQVYNRLKNNHPSAESRGYIEKVTQAKQKYSNLARLQLD